LKTILLAAATLLACALATHAEKIVLRGGTLIRPSNNQILPDATVLIDSDRIANVVAPPDKLDIPKDARVIDCKGKFILPGYIDTHVHFFQSGGLFTRPDGVDLTKIRPYADEIAWIKRNLPDTFQRYLRSGITSVVDVGGPFWNFEVRKIANSTAKAPRVAVEQVKSDTGRESLGQSGGDRDTRRHETAAGPVARSHQDRARQS
jgi:cytosine/adenosine deaminase-related metal-dependent hydrolase